MPVEAIHLSAYDDSLSPIALPDHLLTPEARELGRLGSVAIDFPYFDRFPVGVARYLLKLPTAVSEWGELLHHGRPAEVARGLLLRARALLARGEAEPAHAMIAFTLGFVSHLAVDASVHPFVNRQARARAKRLADTPLRQHSEVEKFHSVLFHEERNGFDFMGTSALGDHIRVRGDRLMGDPVLSAAFAEALGEAVGRPPPSRALLGRWVRGYAQYCWLVSTPAGKILMPEAVKREVRDEVYRGAWGSFQEVYTPAVAASRAAMEAAYRFVSPGDELGFFAHVPQGAIDDLEPTARPPGS
jgi:Zinc dependent phospholipase C